MLLEWCILIHPPFELFALVASHKKTAPDIRDPPRRTFNVKKKRPRILNVSIRDLHAETMHCPHQKKTAVVARELPSPGSATPTMKGTK